MTISAREYLDRFMSTDGSITDFTGRTTYDGDITENMPRTEVDTSESDRAVASAPQGGGTGIASDSGKGGADFVEYYANLGNSKKEDTKSFLDSFYDRSRERHKQSTAIDGQALDRNIARSIQSPYDRANLATANIFGDIFSADYKAPKWENSSPKEVERPDLAGLYESIRKDLPRG